MELRIPDDSLAQRLAPEIPDLVHATGPVSYDYHFARRGLFDALIKASWLTPGTLFAADTTTVALDGDTLLGIEIGFHGPEFRTKQGALGPLWEKMLADGDATGDELTGLLDRAEKASWLNPVVRPKRYYIHALAVKPESRGKNIGAALIQNAQARGRQLGCTHLELDVLSDNPATRFYRAQGLELLAETRAPEPLEYGVPPEWRMGRPLQSEGAS